MTASAFDIAILGAGPVGRVLALMLARVAPDPARIALLQARPRLHGDAAPTADPRVLAMNHGSRVLLESLDAWPERSADIRSIHVSQRGRLGRSLIRHTDFDVPQLGSVVGYSGLYARLEARVAQCGVTLLSGPPPGSWSRTPTACASPRATPNCAAGWWCSPTARAARTCAATTASTPC